MIDFIKIHALPVDAEKVLNNDLLTFPLSNVATTGEVLNRPQTAEYRGLKISVRPGGQVSLRGSLHKCWEDGTNYKDFTLNDIKHVVRELAKTFEFDPAKAVINFVEIGVNIPLDYCPSDLIRTTVMYRNTPFLPLRVDGKGSGKVCETQRFDLKIYDKSLQYSLPGHLLRYEVKIKRTEFFRTYGINALVLADLTKQDIYPQFLKILTDILNGILFYDPQIDPDKITNPKDRELFIEGRYPEYWKNLPRQRKNEKIKRFSELAGSGKIKSELTEKIKTKWNELTTFSHRPGIGKPDKLTTLHIDPETENPGQVNHFPGTVKKGKTGQINPKVTCYFVRCPITNLPLTHQKQGSKYLTSSGINWYRKNEPETYQNKLKTVLTEKWETKHQGDPVNVWVDEIAHQIRNKYFNPGNNPRNNTKRNFENLENKGLKLFSTWELLAPEKKKLIV